MDLKSQTNNGSGSGMRKDFRHGNIRVLHLKKKLYGPFLWIGFNCLKLIKPLLFTNKSPEIPGTYLINLGKIKG